MTTINECVQQSLTQNGFGQYSNYATPVVRSLVDREHQIVGRLIQFGTQQGLNETTLRTALTECGMEVPAPQPVQAVPAMAQNDATADPSADPVLRMLGDIQTQIAGLTQFARDNGYRG